MAESALYVPASQTGWQRRFFTIWLGQVFSLLGSQLVQFALIWHLTAQTGSAVTLTFAVLAEMLPGVVLMPFIGTWTDRLNRRKVMIIADSTIALITIGLLSLFVLGKIQIWHIYLAMLIRSTCERFHMSAMGASTVMLVPQEHLARVQGMNQALNGGMNLFSAPLGAFLLAQFAISSVLMIDIITAVLAVLPLLFFKIPQPQRTNEASTFWQDLHEGVRFVMRWRGLVISLCMVTFINFVLTPTIALTPLLVTQHFGRGVQALGWMNAAIAVGIIVGGVILGIWGGFKRKIILAMLGLSGLGVGTLILGIMPAAWFWGALIAQIFTGLMIPFCNGSFGAIMQSIIPAELQGRVFGFIMSAATAISPLGLLIAGPLAQRLGIQWWFILGGSVTLALGVLGFMIPSLMCMEDHVIDPPLTAVEA